MNRRGRANGGRSGGRKETPAKSTGEQNPNRGVAAPHGRMHLTILQREGKIWTVYFSLPNGSTGGTAQLEFEREGDSGEPIRFVRALPEPLLDALQNGRSLKRDALQQELELAVTGAAAAPDELE